MDSLPGAILFIGLATGGALIGMFTVRRLVGLARLQPLHEVAGYHYAVVGAIYGVLMAFVVSVVWGRYDRGEQAVAHETSALVDMARLAGGIDEPTRTNARLKIHEYIEDVINDEWPLMVDGQSSLHVETTLDQLTQLYLAEDLGTASETAAHAQSVARLSDVIDNRATRLLLARSGLPFPMWVVLIIGGQIAIAFSFFFGVRSPLANALIVVTLAVSIGLVLYLIAALDFPFRGAISIGPEPFRSALFEIDRIGSTVGR